MTITRTDVLASIAAALSGLRVFALALVANIPAVMFVIGLVLLYVGVSGFSRAAANVVLGVVLIALSAWPYLRGPKA